MFEQKYEKINQNECFSENFQFFVVNFSIYLNRRVFVMHREKNKASFEIHVRYC